MRQGWIDIHCHILPFVDDGAKDWDLAKSMLQSAYAEGIRGMIATPHFQARHMNRADRQQRVEEVYRKLSVYAKEIHPDFELYLGNELYYFSDVFEALKNNQLHTLANSNYVLTEFHPAQDFQEIKRNLSNLLNYGYFPVLAHVERYQCFMKNWKLLLELEDMGIYLQANASSVLGARGRKARSFLNRLLSLEMLHFIATDAHNLEERAPHVAQCASYIEKKFGSAYQKRLLYENPLAVIHNEII